MKKIKSALLTFVIKTIGRLSKGLNISSEHGLTSGLMLDYVYENKSHGKFIIGKFLDRIFLNNVSWKAIRQRKQNLKTQIRLAIEENRTRGEKTVILDVAAGPAQYLIDVMSEIGEHDVSAVCQDIDDKWMASGREKAGGAGLKNIKFEKSDAFDENALSSISPRPNVVVASGLYDWIVNDELVKRSLKLCCSVLDENGTIIFTNQAGNKQIDLVHKAFLDFNKEPLRMKTRSPETLNSWAMEAGFKDTVATVMDKWGFYSVARIKK